VDVLRRPDRCHIQQDVGGSRHRRPGYLAVQLEELSRLLEETGPGPVALHLVAGRDGEQRLLSFGFGQGLARREHADEAIG
jgi:hypothetical protein